MILVLPLGHQVEMKKLPKITIGLIAINIVVFLFTYSIMKTEMKHLASVQKELATRGLSLVFETETNEGDPFGFLFTLPELKQAKTPDDTLEYIAGKLEDKPGKFRQWHKDYEEYKETKGDLLINKLGFVPAEFPSLGFFTHMFLHGGWLHIIFNLWFLYLVGICLEQIWGRFPFLGFYIAGGLAAALLEYVFHPHLQIPMIGASGAVAAAMGAFAIRYGKERIDCLLVAIIFIKPIVRYFTAPAWLLLGLWLGAQLFFAEMYRGMEEQAAVAFWAHIGGFFFGATVAWFVQTIGIDKAETAPVIEEEVKEQTFQQNPNLIEALEHMEQGHYSKAAAKADQVLKYAPKHPDALLVKARALFHTNKKEESRAIFTDMMHAAKDRKERGSLAALFGEFGRLFPETPVSGSLAFAAGRACFEKGDAKGALYAFGQLENLQDSELSAKGLFYIAKVKSELEGNKEESVKAFEKFLANFPGHPWENQAREFLRNLSGN